MFQLTDLLTYDKALLIAVRAHDGQTRDLADGTEPYVMHPIRVATQFQSDHQRLERVVALLHDTVEDTDVTADYISKQIAPVVARSVLVLSRLDGEPYADFIERIAESGDKVAIAVKRADLRDNLRDMPASKQSLRGRYEQALYRLNRKDDGF